MSTFKINVKYRSISIYVYLLISMNVRLNIGTEVFVNWEFFNDLEQPSVWMTNDVSNSLNISTFALYLKYVTNVDL